MTNSEARKRDVERAAMAARTTHAPLSQPHSPEAHSDPTGALGGSEGVEAIRALHSARGMDGEIGYVNDGLSYVQRLCFECDEGVPCRTALLLATLDEARSEVAQLTAKLDMPCGSCHPCNNWANQTWVNAGERLPHVYEWQEMKARARTAESTLASVRELADEWEVRAGQGIGTLSDAVVDLRTLLAPAPASGTAREGHYPGCSLTAGHSGACYPNAMEPAGSRKNHIPAPPPPTTVQADCGHPNHGADDHDCTGFICCENPDCPCHREGEPAMTTLRHTLTRKGRYGGTGDHHFTVDYGMGQIVNHYLSAEDWVALGGPDQIVVTIAVGHADV